jgi:TRAP-type C4-dicarboxylate transport system permease small subunit
LFLIRWLNENVEKAICVALTLVMLIVLSLSVFSRYVLNISISWAEELSIFCLIWLTYFGSVLAVQKRRHLRVLVTEFFLSAKHQKTLDIVCNLIFFLFCIFLTLGSYDMTVLAYRTKQIGAATGLPRWIVIAGIPFALSLMAVRLLQDMKKQFKELKELRQNQKLEIANINVKY